MNQEYYDNLAPYYRYIYPDWEASVEKQAIMLDKIIRDFFGGSVSSILDAACGIGTQCLGLAGLGYKMTGSDISEGELEQAKGHAKTRGLAINFKPADMRELSSVHSGTFDIVMACDNAVPHLLTDEDILKAFKEFYSLSTKTGGMIITVRDYSGIDRAPEKFNPRLVHKTNNGRVILFDIWEFDGDYYDLTTYIVEDDGDVNQVVTAIRGGRYYCVSLETLKMLMEQAGFRTVDILQDGFFQPLLVGRK